MNEFSIIETYFNFTPSGDGVVFGVGDDAACVEIPDGQQLLISSDTLVAGVHFLNEWDAYDIAWKGLMVNISDIAAMGAVPKWFTLALTLPDNNVQWLERFSQGLQAASKHYGLSLIGGDTTRGPLCFTITIHGLAPKGCAVRRSGAAPDDSIWLSNNIGAAALAVRLLYDPNIDRVKEDFDVLMEKLLHPEPRADFMHVLRNCASAAIDISDGLSADLFHICEASRVGACIDESQLPVHPLVFKYCPDAVERALCGGDDYELCFTVPPQKVPLLASLLESSALKARKIGVIESFPGLRLKKLDNSIQELPTKGYQHF